MDHAIQAQAAQLWLPLAPKAVSGAHYEMRFYSTTLKLVAANSSSME